jgi:hypothetical protein
MGCAARIAWALASCMLAVGSGQGIRPPCELDPGTLNGRGATLREYPGTDGHHIYCHLEHVCDNSVLQNACIIPDDESCLVDCDAGYEDGHHYDTNELHCRPGDGGHLPELDFDFSCTGTPPCC